MKSAPTLSITLNKRRSPAVHYLPYLFLLLVLLVSGCGGNDENPPAVEESLVRQARPTFTPTPQLAVVQPQIAETPAASQASSGEPQVASNQAATQASVTTTTTAPSQSSANGKAFLVISEEVVNARSGPGTNYPVVEFVGRGDQFDITGKSADNEWWQVCCVKEQQVWITQKFADADGAVDSVPVVTNPSNAPVAQQPAQATSTTAAAPVAAVNPAPANPAPTANQAPAQPTATPAPAPPAFAFILQSQEQFPDTNVVHIFLYVYGGNEALSGYSLRVAKNGVELPINAQPSGGPLPQLTWPIADQRQRLQNFKVEFPGEAPGGTWEVQLTQDGKPVGPPAKFQLADNEPNRELYVRYQKQ